MCLYPTIILNKRYLPTRKNKLNPPICTDERMRFVPAKCGKCYECRKEKAREWRIRMTEELKQTFGYFVTLTFSNEAFEELENKIKLDLNKNENTIATKGLRWFLERVRKNTGKSIKHWFCTELGEDKDRLHLHGILFDQKAIELCRKHWKYGNVFVGNYCNEKTVNYITKYMLKYDVKHKDYTQIVLCSKGIGKNYLESRKGWDQKDFVYCKKIPHYKFSNGYKVPMPKYYRDKIFDDTEKEIMWRNILNSNETFVHGERVKMDDDSTINNLRDYYKAHFVQTQGDSIEAWEEQKKLRKEERWRKWLKEPTKYFEGKWLKANEIRRIKADRKAGINDFDAWRRHIDFVNKGRQKEIDEEKKQKRNEEYLNNVLMLDNSTYWANKIIQGCPF